MKRFLAGICVVTGLAVLGACGGNDSSTVSGWAHGTPSPIASAAAAGSATQLGGAIQGKVVTFSNVSTVAGTAGTPGSADANKLSASFSQPNGVTTDGTSLYIADYNNHIIRKINIATGEVTLFAGTRGVAGYLDGAGTSAQFRFPNGITTDGTYLYVTDSGNNMVRKIAISDATVSPLAGSPNLTGSTDAKGDQARFNQLNGITTDGNFIYVSDSNNSIRFIDKNTGDVKTLTGTPGTVGSADGARDVARFSLPARLTCDGQNLYVCDFNNKTVRKVAIATGAVSTIAGTVGNGILSGGQFDQPNGITTDGTYLYVTDAYNNTIHRMTLTGGGLVPIAGAAGIAGTTDGISSAARFHTPIGITTDGTSLFVTDTQNHTIRKIH